MKIKLLAVFLVSGLAACAGSGIKNMAPNEISVFSTTGGACLNGLPILMRKRAAMETIRRNYDFFSVEHEHSNTSPRIFIPGKVPVFVGGETMNSIHVLMYKTGHQPKGRAINARALLGADWKKIIEDAPSGVSFSGCEG